MTIAAPRLFIRITMAVVFAMVPVHALADLIRGSATYRERMALQPGTVFEATLEDVSRADAPAQTIATHRVVSPEKSPIEFAILYERSKIIPNHRYVVRGKILQGKALLFITDTSVPVVPAGNLTGVSLVLRKVAASPPPTTSAANASLGGTYWSATELAGKPVATGGTNREAHLTFQPGGRVAGADGCNLVSGRYELKGEAVKFGPLLGTQMACVDSPKTERPFRDALKNAARLTIAGDRLELFDGANRKLAAFTARSTATPPASASAQLENTSWRLVGFRGGDGKTLTPDDRWKYTIDLASGGQLTARIDCNRGRGTWQSKGANQIQFGPLALTRAKCPPRSLHDQIVKQWGNVRSYVIRDRHLYLSLMADGGIYEFEPVSRGRITPRSAPR